MFPCGAFLSFVVNEARSLCFLSIGYIMISNISHEQQPIILDEILHVVMKYIYIIMISSAECSYEPTISINNRVLPG